MNARSKTMIDDTKEEAPPPGDAVVVGSGGMGSSLLHLSPLQKQISISVTVTLLSLWSGKLPLSIFIQESV